jgi:hypothetical protein
LSGCATPVCLGVGCAAACAFRGLSAPSACGIHPRRFFRPEDALRGRVSGSGRAPRAGHRPAPSRSGRRRTARCRA